MYQALEGPAARQRFEEIVRARNRERLDHLAERAPWLAAYDPLHVLVIDLAGRRFVLAELTDDGSACAAGQDANLDSIVGTTEPVVAGVSDLPVDDPWVQATGRALA